MTRKQRYFAAGFVLLMIPVASALAAGMPNTFFAGDPIVAEDVNENFEYVAPPNIVNVNAGANATASGTALMDALDPATLAAIAGAPSASNRYLVRVGPGVYDVGTSTATLPEYVSIQGSGQGATRILSSFGATLGLDSHTGISDMTVIISGTGTVDAVFVLSDSSAVTIDNVEIVVQGTSDPSGIRIQGATASVTNTYIHFDTGSTVNGGQAIIVTGTSNVHLDSVRMERFGPTSGSASFLRLAESSGVGTVMARNLTMVSESNGGGGTFRGVRIEGNGHHLRLHDTSMILDRSSGTLQGIGNLSGNSRTDVQNTTIRLSGDATRTPLFINNGGALFNVNQSILVNGSGGATDYFLRMGSNGGTVNVGTSLLDSANYDVSGSPATEVVRCIFTYNGNYESAICQGPVD